MRRWVKSPAPVRRGVDDEHSDSVGEGLQIGSRPGHVGRIDDARPPRRQLPGVRGECARIGGVGYGERLRPPTADLNLFAGTDRHEQHVIQSAEPRLYLLDDQRMGVHRDGSVVVVPPPGAETGEPARNVGMAVREEDRVETVEVLLLREAACHVDEDPLSALEQKRALEPARPAATRCATGSSRAEETGVGHRRSDGSRKMRTKVPSVTTFGGR